MFEVEIKIQGSIAHIYHFSRRIFSARHAANLAQALAGKEHGRSNSVAFWYVARRVS